MIKPWFFILTFPVYLLAVIFLFIGCFFFRLYNGLYAQLVDSYGDLEWKMFKIEICRQYRGKD